MKAENVVLGRKYGVISPVGSLEKKKKKNTAG